MFIDYDHTQLPTISLKKYVRVVWTNQCHSHYSTTENIHFESPWNFGRVCGKLVLKKHVSVMHGHGLLLGTHFYNQQLVTTDKDMIHHFNEFLGQFLSPIFRRILIRVLNKLLNNFLSWNLNLQFPMGFIFG